MNLNFIQDNDKVHVQTQNQIAYKQQIILKTKLLSQDYKDYSLINPQLNDINSYFSVLVKQLFQNITNNKIRVSKSDKDNVISNQIQQNAQQAKRQQVKKRKKISIPYQTLKKLQNLKQKIIQCRKILDKQNIFYKFKNINRQNEKNSEVRFYKNVLKSYEEERQFYKKETLEVEDRIQEVEKEIEKQPSYQNHKFTDYESRLLIFQDRMRLEKKDTAYQNVLSELKLLKKTKMNILNELNKPIETENKQKVNQQPTKSQSKQTEPVQNQKPSNSKKYIPYNKTLSKPQQQIIKKLNILKLQKYQFSNSVTQKYYQKNIKLKKLNQKLKKSILQYENEKFFIELQKRINEISQNLRRSKQQIQQLNNGQGQNKRITKTDYLIYLKELASNVGRYFKSKELSFNSGIVMGGKKRSKSIE